MILGMSPLPGRGPRRVRSPQLPGGAPECPRAMVDLAVARGERHAVLGDPADLDAAVRLIEDRERRPGWPRRA